MSVDPTNASGFRAPISSALKAERMARTSAALTDLVEHLPQKLPFPFSGVVAFKVWDGPIIQAAYFPDADRADRFSPEVPMNILSVGKLFTAVATMQLIEEGKFSLKTPLKELLDFGELKVPLRPPYVEESEEALEKARTNYANITVEHLLSHTAGLGKAPPPEGSPEGTEWRDTKIGEYGYSKAIPTR